MRHHAALLALVVASMMGGMRGSAAVAADAGQGGKYNVLFIVSDDLRPELSCYGVPLIKSPNIDALAASGLQFNRAYCQQAVCSPSRTSLLTGRRPDTTKVYDLVTHFRDHIPDVVTLPQYFKDHGYYTAGFSKIYHDGYDDPKSWSVPHWDPERKKNRAGGTGGAGGAPDTTCAADKGKAARKEAARGPAFDSLDITDDQQPDGMTAGKVIEVLREVKDKRFFLAVGMRRPHLPFVSPKRYWDLYNPSDLKLASNPYPPKDAPAFAMTTWGELRRYSNIPGSGPLSDDVARQMIHGYYAAVSYMDAQVGRVLAELKKLDLEKDTIVVLWGDHGWQLGDHGLWCKHTNFERAAHAPLILRVPGQKNAGAKTDALVEFVDVYPTLCEAAGLPVPGGLEGTSAMPLVDDPTRAWKSAAFSQYPRGGGIMGYSMKTDRYRYTEWRHKDGSVAATELYDHKTDPDENVNAAGHADRKAVVAGLAAELRAGWQAARPK